MKNIFYSRLFRRMFLTLCCASMYLYVSETPNHTTKYQTNTIQGMIAKTLHTCSAHKIETPSINVKIPLAEGVMDIKGTAGEPILPFASLEGVAKEFNQWKPSGSLGEFLQCDVNTIPSLVTNHFNAFRKETWNAAKPYVYAGCLLILIYMTYHVWDSYQQRVLKRKEIEEIKNRTIAIKKQTLAMNRLAAALEESSKKRLLRRSLSSTLS